jgi:hypothetical protein
MPDINGSHTWISEILHSLNLTRLKDNLLPAIDVRCLDLVSFENLSSRGGCVCRDSFHPLIRLFFQVDGIRFLCIKDQVGSVWCWIFEKVRVDSKDASKG